MTTDINLEKYFRCYAKIDLDAIYENVKTLKSNLDDKTEVMAVVKTDGYGHGAVPIAKTIDDLCCSYAVATVYEGENLRKHGIDKPIYILGYTPEYAYDLVIEKEMIPAVFSYDTAMELSRHASKLGKKVNINIAVDTGMSRIGYIPSAEAVEEIVQISKLPGINILSIFTHFAKADYKDKTFSHKQYGEFIEFIKLLEENGINIKIHQCANSAAMMEMPETGMNVARAGISMYGLYPSEEISRENMELKPALSLYSHVIQVKTIDKGRGVSYGQTFIADKDMQIATIPIGYGDGYPRNLSNKGYVLIKGKKAYVVGRVCMDQFMVDVTDIPDIKEGDLVTLIGRDEGEVITVDEVSEIAGTFNYEFICDLGKRVPRVYYKDNKVIGAKDYFEDLYEINM